MEASESEIPLRQRRRYRWLAILLGVLLSMGGCTFITLRYVYDKGNAGLMVSRARQVLIAVHIYRDDHDQRSPESIKTAFGATQPGPTSEDYPPEQGKSWHYFKPEDGPIGARVVILVSPRSELGYGWLRKRRVIGWSDTDVEIVLEDTEVPLPSGKKARLSDLP